MTNQEILDRHNYSPEDREELMCAMALFQMANMDFHPINAFKMASGHYAKAMQPWWRRIPIPAGFRLFEVRHVNPAITAKQQAAAYCKAIDDRTMGFEVALRMPCYWVVRLDDYYTLTAMQAEFEQKNPELAL